MQCTCHLVLQFGPIYPCMVLPAQKNKNSNAWVGDISQHTNQSLVPNHFHISSEQVNFMPGICIYGMQEKGTTLLKIGSLQSFHYLRVNALLWAMQTASLCSCNLAMLLQMESLVSKPQVFTKSKQSWEEVWENCRSSLVYPGMIRIIHCL